MSAWENGEGVIKLETCIEEGSWIVLIDLCAVYHGGGKYSVILKQRRPLLPC